MLHSTLQFMLVAASLLLTTQANAEPLAHIGTPVRGIPVAKAVKVGKLVFVSGTPAYDRDGKLAVGEFPAQMKQVMENVSATLKDAGTDWNRVVKTTVFLVRSGDFAEMNRIYAAYFPDGAYPARTTATVAALPSPDFLVEIECEAVLE